MGGGMTRVALVTMVLSGAGWAQPKSAIEFYDTTGTDAAARLGWQGPRATGKLFVESPVGTELLNMQNGRMTVNGQMSAASFHGDGSGLTGVAPAGHSHTIAQIAPAGITGANIATGTIGTLHIQDSAVTDAKIRHGLNAAKITTGTLPNHVLDPNLQILANPTSSISGSRVIPRFGTQQAYFGDGIYFHDQNNETVGYGLGCFHGPERRGFGFFEYQSHRFKRNLLDCGWDSDTLQCWLNLRVAGTVTASSCCQPSDSRFKRNVSPLTDALPKVRCMNAVTYELAQDTSPQDRFAPARQIGLIAQELEPLIPEAVKTDAAGYKYIDYSRLVPVLAEAIKEQQVQIDELRQEIQKLRASE